MDYLWTFIAFGVYLLVMLLIGFLSIEKDQKALKIISWAGVP